MQSSERVCNHQHGYWAGICLRHAVCLCICVCVSAGIWAYLSGMYPAEHLTLPTTFYMAGARLDAASKQTDTWSMLKVSAARVLLLQARRQPQGSAQWFSRPGVCPPASRSGWVLTQPNLTQCQPLTCSGIQLAHNSHSCMIHKVPHSCMTHGHCLGEGGCGRGFICPASERCNNGCLYCRMYRRQPVMLVLPLPPALPARPALPMLPVLSALSALLVLHTGITAAQALGAPLAAGLLAMHGAANMSGRVPHHPGYTCCKPNVQSTHHTAAVQSMSSPSHYYSLFYILDLLCSQAQSHRRAVCPTPLCTLLLQKWTCVHVMLCPCGRPAMSYFCLRTHACRLALAVYH
jgi:hypothetical protein